MNTRESKRPTSTIPACLLMLALTACSGEDAPAAQLVNEPVDTPRLTAYETIESEDQQLVTMRQQFPGANWNIGMAAACDQGQPTIVVSMGPYPSDRRPTQLAVRTPDNAVQRFGPVTEGGPESGFHSPLVTGAEDIERFVDAATQPGALVSNGYNSFFNDAEPADSEAFRQLLANC